MAIRIRPRETNGRVTTHPVTDERPGGDRTGMPPPGPEVLLSSGSEPLPARVPASARALALDALRLSRALRDPSRRPARWAQPAFGAEIELIRRHLAPIRSRQTLAASYGREAFHVSSTDRATDDQSPIRLAYALRWMELRDGATGPSWPTLLG
jgi:hypothetical protein